MLKKHTDFVSNYLKEKPLSIKKLKGDASERKYFRVTTKDEKTFILMEDTDNPEKNSIESYMELTDILLNNNVCVPNILARKPKQNLLLLSDAGNDSLFDICNKSTKDTVIDFYKKAIDEMIKIHTILPAQEKNCFSLAFDTEKLMWEMDFFLTHAKSYVPKLSDSESDFFRKNFKKICTFLSEQERVLTHRDYHSRNIMVKGSKLILIDFQDARMGPHAYDLVSLIKDSYMDLNDVLVDELLKYYLQKTGKNKSDFIQGFNLMTFQRSIKACGSFCYLESKMGKTGYMQHFPKALAYAKKAILAYDEFKEFSEQFFPAFEKIS